MDRFIAGTKLLKNDACCDLKSNMDRFIVCTALEYRPQKLQI